MTPSNTAEQQAKAVALKEGEHNPYVHGLLEQASSLKEEKEALFKRVGANREALRQAQTTGFVSKDQSKAIDEWYPKPKKGEANTTAPASA